MGNYLEILQIKIAELSFKYRSLNSDVEQRSLSFVVSP